MKNIWTIATAVFICSCIICAGAGSATGKSFRKAGHRSNDPGRKSKNGTVGMGFQNAGHHQRRQKKQNRKNQKRILSVKKDFQLPPHGSGRRMQFRKECLALQAEHML